MKKIHFYIFFLGKYTWSNGKWYDGDWEDGFRHGEGMMHSGHGEDRYEGEWKRGKPEGKGTLYQVFEYVY